MFDLIILTLCDIMYYLINVLNSSNFIIFTIIIKWIKIDFIFYNCDLLEIPTLTPNNFMFLNEYGFILDSFLSSNIFFYQNYFYSSITVANHSNNFTFDNVFFLNRLYVLNKFLLLNSNYLNMFLNFNKFEFEHFDNFNKFFFTSLDSFILYKNHPEFKLFFNTIFDNLIINYFLNENILKNNLNVTSENNIINNIVILFSFVFIIILVKLFLIQILFYSNKGYQATMVMYFFSNLMYESEEEIGSIDDLIISLIVVFNIFFWFFCFTAIYTIVDFSANIIFSLFFPLFYIFIFSMPILILLFLGLVFVTFLRGSGSTKLFFLEAMYDYIAASAYFIRLIVQNVRLILMFLTIASFHEMIIMLDFYSQFSANELCSTNKINHFGNDGISFNIMYTSYLILLKLIYEILHTYFVVISQFIAFFAMVFWLFLFLYTGFLKEKMEHFFFLKRKFLSFWHLTNIK